MVPMTRTRTPENVPGELTALYYAQRASAGLIITEGLPVPRRAAAISILPASIPTNRRAAGGW
jgi:N-ethylmaleimide reductase